METADVNKSSVWTRAQSFYEITPQVWCHSRFFYDGAFSRRSVSQVNAEFPRTCPILTLDRKQCRASGHLETKVLVRKARRHTATGRAAQEPDLDQERLIHLFERVFIFGQSGRKRV